MNQPLLSGVELGEADGSEVDVPAVVTDLARADQFAGQYVGQVNVPAFATDLSPCISGDVSREH